jgi:hypothetical protein
VTRPTVPVPEDVLMHLRHAITESTSRFALDVWIGPGDVVRMGDPFGRVIAWLWQTDPDTAVETFGEMLHRIRHVEPNATKAITLDDALKGFRLDLPGHGVGEGEPELLDRLRRDLPARFREDPNVTS